MVAIMPAYKNRSGNSGIIAYEIGRTFIKVRFRDGFYNYTYAQPGKAQVEEMKKLAASGKGLSTFISRFVKENYASKLS